MPRTLPWLVGQSKDGQVKRESTPRKRVKRERTPDDEPTPRNHPASPDKRDFFRSSQTPPTSPVRPSPAQEFLIEGLDQDDGWVMVEDEFYAIAQSFTQHLHYAEYVRRKKEAKARSTETISEMRRPTDGRTPLSKESERKKKAEALYERQKAGLAQPEDQNDDKDDSDDDETWAGTHLHGLMASPRKSRSLVGSHPLRSNTRAAAGFGQSASSSGSQYVAGASSSKAAAAHIVEIEKATASDADADLDGETTSDGDDDLDGQAHPVTVARPKRVHTQEPKAVQKPIQVAQPQRDGGRKDSRYPKPTIKEEELRPAPKPTRGFKSKVQMLFDDLDELPEPSRSNTSISDLKQSLSSTDHINQPGPASDSLNPKKSRFNDVPTFLL